MSYENEEYQEPENKSGAKKALVIGTIIALLAINGFMFYNWSQQKKRSEALENQLTLTDSLKKGLEGEKEQNVSKIGELEDQNASLDSLRVLNESEIADAKSRLAELGQKQKLTMSELTEAKSLIKQLRSAESRYKLKIDSFLTINESLIVEKEKLIADNERLNTEKKQLTSDLDNEKSTVSKLSSEKEDLTNKGKVLKVSNILFMGMQKKGSKDVSTDKAKKVDRIDVSFDVQANPIASNGSRTAYIRLLDPTGKVISSNEGTVQTAGVMCSKKVNFDYNKSGATVKTNIVPTGKLEEGRYTVEVYIEEQLAGKGSDALRKSFL